MPTPSIHIGTCSWKYDEWKGVFYPKTGDELPAYAQVFTTVEIDSTWHFAPAPKVVESWERRAPEGFRFAAKVPKEITHERRLIGCADALEGFLTAMSLLGDKRGPLLLQFPPTWSRDEGLGALRDFLPLVSDAGESGWQFAAEFRNSSWWRDDIAQLLQHHGVAWCLADHGNWWQGETRPPLYVTTDWSYIRFRGDKYEEFGPYDRLQRDRSAEERKWLDALSELPVEDVWGYFANQWAGFAPGSAHGFRRQLGQEVPPLDVAVVSRGKAPSGQGSLFDL